MGAPKNKRSRTERDTPLYAPETKITNRRMGTNPPLLRNRPPASLTPHPEFTTQDRQKPKALYITIHPSHQKHELPHPAHQLTLVGYSLTKETSVNPSLKLRKKEISPPKPPKNKNSFFNNRWCDKTAVSAKQPQTSELALNSRGGKDRGKSGRG